MILFSSSEGTVYSHLVSKSHASVRKQAPVVLCCIGSAVVVQFACLCDALAFRGAWLGAMGGLLTGCVIGILTQLGALAIGCTTNHRTEPPASNPAFACPPTKTRNGFRGFPELSFTRESAYGVLVPCHNPLFAPVRLTCVQWVRRWEYCWVLLLDLRPLPESSR